MLTRINKAMAKKDSGFTLIELLVVVIIIGILAAIAIPTFLNQREAGFRAAVESDLRNAATAAETFAVEAGGEYGAAGELQTYFDELDGGVLVNFNPSEGVENVEATATADGTGFCIEAGHESLGATTYGFGKVQGEPLEGTCAVGVFTPAP